MPNERAISQMMEIFTEVIDLGGVEERTAIVPNLSVIDAAPTGLTNFIIVQDDRDGDNILAKTVPGVVYANNDKVNVLFIKGGEPIAFQQGSESPNAGLWEIVPSTSTDIFYDKGDVGIGKSVAPDASLEILDTAQAQLRLTHTEDAKFVDFTLDTNHDLTITPSSTGQIILQPTTDSTDFFQVLDADGGAPVLNVDSTNERIGIGTSAPNQTLELVENTAGGSPIVRLSLGDTSVASGEILGRIEGFSNDTQASGVAGSLRWLAENAFTSAATFDTEFIVTTTVNGSEFDRLKITSDGDVGVNVTSPLGKLHVDQTNASGNKPVAYFDQADVSEEMFEFASTIGVGNAIEAVGAKTLTTTHFIKVTIPGGLTRYFPVGTIA